MIQIAIIGAGQLGSRHLQALAGLEQEVKIQVVDPFPASLETAVARLHEVRPAFSSRVTFHTSIAELDRRIDIAIIATSSNVRCNVITQLLEHASVDKLILEKFLFPRAEEYAIVARLLREKRVKAWVNCFRRMLPFYQELRRKLSGNIHFAATGNMWGMGGNGIHVLDLFTFLTQTGHTRLSAELLDNTVIESRRSGYIEFTGTVTGISGHHSFRMTSYSSGTPSELFITIDTPAERYCIDEAFNGIGRTGRLVNNTWQWEESPFEMPYQSRLTTLLVDELLRTGGCNLPTYEESAPLHLNLLDLYLSFLRQLSPNTTSECLIT